MVIPFETRLWTISDTVVIRIVGLVGFKDYSVLTNGVTIADLENLNLSSQDTTMDKLVNKKVELSGSSQLHLASEIPMKSSIIDFKSPEAWLFFDNLKAKVVIELFLNKIKVNGGRYSDWKECKSGTICQWGLW